MKLSSCLHLVPRPGKSGTVPCTPIHVNGMALNEDQGQGYLYLNLNLRLLWYSSVLHGTCCYILALLLSSSLLSLICNHLYNIYSANILYGHEESGVSTLGLTDSQEKAGSCSNKMVAL
jgi:phage gp36-like protein